MRRIATCVAAVLICGLSAASAAETVGGANAFSFVALGDMPYRIPGDYERFDRLIAAINKSAPAFSIHIGDIKAGSTPCTDESFAKVLDQFRSFEQPLVYAIGDNEWTDCHRPAAGRFDPRERLARLRQMFFVNPGMSLGRQPMAVESQAKAMPDHAKYVENVRFSKNGVQFTVLHVVGSNNGFEPTDPAAATEYFERNAANMAWLAASFRLATEQNAKAMVIAFQANPYDIRQAYPEMPPVSGFVDLVRAIDRGARGFRKPILVVWGDTHVLDIGPFRDTRGKPIPNVIHLQVMGEDYVHAVRVTVDPDSGGVFGFIPLIVPENGDF